MLGWMLQRGNATDANQAADTTADELPDTPAPVFAARALRRAVFGAPQPHKQTSGKSAHQSLPNDVSDTPSKPQSILLTPGTGTSKRKRVSFGHPVPKSKTGAESLRYKLGEDEKRTRLQRNGDKGRKTKLKEQGIASDSEWEEDDGDEEDVCNHDVTMDLNEPHSQSGRFWKDEYHKYQQEAKAEMAKLLQYKQLAKSYAHQKDAEAIRLTDMLKTEQQKVIDMERKIAESTSRMLANQHDDQGDVLHDDLTKVNKYKARAVYYRQRVQDLEQQLAEKKPGHDVDDRDGTTQGPSPRTRGTLLETQRELRLARSQLKELDRLRLEVKSLKSQLREAERTSTAGSAPTLNSRAQLRELREQLRAVKEEAAEKDLSMKQLKAEFARFKQDTEAHDEDMKTILDRAHTRIAELKAEAKQSDAARASGTSSARVKRLPSTADEKPRRQTRVELFNGSQEEKKLGRDYPEKERERAYHAELPEWKDGESEEVGEMPTRSGTLRDRYRADRPLQTRTSYQPSGEPGEATSHWRPFVPRSPKDRAYLGERLEGKIANGGATPAALKSKIDSTYDLVALAKATSKQRKAGERSRGEEPQLDVLKERFAPSKERPLRKAGSAASKWTSSKRHASADQRAAVLARIEERMAKRKSELKAQDLEKENVRPY